MDLREEAYRRFDEARPGVLGAAERGGVELGMPDWIEGFGEKGMNGETGCWRLLDIVSTMNMENVLTEGSRGP